MRLNSSSLTLTTTLHPASTIFPVTRAGTHFCCDSLYLIIYLIGTRKSDQEVQNRSQSGEGLVQLAVDETAQPPAVFLPLYPSTVSGHPEHAATYGQPGDKRPAIFPTDYVKNIIKLKHK
jgi:hypothetical protein